MRKFRLDMIFAAIFLVFFVLVASVTWTEHSTALDRLTEFHAHRLTVRPQMIKCEFQTSDLTVMTKRRCQSKIQWTAECDVAFQKLKAILSCDPVVVLPDFAKPFVVRSDASSTGIGAVLLEQQPEGDSCLHPVLYASRKLLDRETRYSTVERECLALVWAVDKFHRYLFGRHFVIETDHKPLSLLKKKTGQTNSRLLRWSLALQDYTFSVMPISGTVNVEADVLSRLT
jgi:hypothetical protein